MYDNDPGSHKKKKNIHYFFFIYSSPTSFNKNSNLDIYNLHLFFSHIEVLFALNK